jgi:hypothetical protein
MNVGQADGTTRLGTKQNMASYAFHQTIGGFTDCITVVVMNCPRSILLSRGVSVCYAKNIPRQAMQVWRNRRARVKATITYSKCDCRLWCPAWNKHASYYLRPVRLYHIFRYYRTNVTIFEGKILSNIKCVFWFSLQLISETFIILRNERDIIINIPRCSCRVPVILVRFNKKWIVYKHFRRVLEYQISWKSVQWEQRCSMRSYRRAEKHHKFNSRFSKFQERAQKWSFTLNTSFCTCTISDTHWKNRTFHQT